MKKKLILIMVLVAMFMNSMVAMAGGVNAEKTARKATYFKAGVLWDLNGRANDNPSNKDINDMHVDGELPYLNDVLNLENINYKKIFNVGIFNLTIVFFVSKEPLP